MESIQNLIGALREELQEYGEMLALLDRQHQIIMVRDADEVFQSISIIKAQGLAIQKARAERENAGAASPRRNSASRRTPLSPSSFRNCRRITVRWSRRWWTKTTNCWCACGNGRARTICC